MEKIVIYKAVDGKTFKNPEKCEAHEEFLMKVRVIESLLVPLSKEWDGGKFANGTGYIQQDLRVVHEVKSKIMDLASEVRPGIENMQYRMLKVWIPQSSPLYPIIDRVECIDRFGREWGQPAFTVDPGELVCLNP